MLQYRVSSWSWFAWDFAGLSTEGSASWKFLTRGKTLPQAVVQVRDNGYLMEDAESSLPSTHSGESVL